MEPLTGMAAAAVASAGAAGTFEYNRENFLTDREQRRRATVKVMSWRVEQAKLWRQDVRDLISLTEYKMQMYLIVNIFLFGCTIFLYTEGKLPSGTPHWLMVGNIISIGSAFVFLLLSIWLAMHAAVSAQSFEARILTQMVRLPIPTWEEVEATRTYASDFEKMEGRQMFRVPWLMGWQEGLLGRPPPSASISSLDSTVPAGAATTAPGEGVGAAGDAAATASRNANPASGGTERFADPWGLEQGVSAADMPELGCPMDAEVAKLRHVTLSRQAAIQWQSYDAFSRISMSIGVQQLMQAMSYYILGYLLVQVGSKMAAVLGVVGITMTANMTVNLDMKSRQFAWWKLGLTQVLLSLGPACSTLAAFAWADFSNSAAEFIVPMAFISHGLYFGLIAAFCGDTVHHHGSHLPVAFNAVLYLDVFAWAHYDSQPSGLLPPESSLAADAVSLAGRPALQSVIFANGVPFPTRPQDLCPDDITRDLRRADGAPDISISTASAECGREGFYSPASFLPVKKGSSGASTARTNDPRDTPWRVFCVTMFLVGFVWLTAAVYCIHGARTGWSLDLPLVERRHPSTEQPRQPGFLPPELSDTGAVPWWKIAHNRPTSVKWDRWETHSFLSDSQPQASFLAIRPASVVGAPEQILLSWPWPNSSPTHLTCDAAGRNFVMADRIGLYKGTIDTDAGGAGPGHKHRAVFREFGCSDVLGEGLEDVAMSCASTAPSKGMGCEVLALHRHGRRLATCPLAEGTTLSSSNVETVSETWLENYNPKKAAEGGKARSRMEKSLSIAINPECKGEAGSESCLVVGTTHGRVVQLGRHSTRNELIPTEVLYEVRGKTPLAPSNGAVRAFNRQYLGLLKSTDGNIQLLDLKRGGLAVGTIELGLPKPAASFCAGGGHVYVLTQGVVPELWRIAVPKELQPTT